MHLRRATGIFALMGALVLTPAAATAGTYPAPEQPVVTSSLPGTVATLGDPFTMTIAAADGSEVTLTVQHDEAPDEAIQIAGQASHTKIAQGGGATFSVTLAHHGTFTLIAAVDGEIVSTHVITVPEATEPEPDSDADAADDAADPVPAADPSAGTPSGGSAQGAVTSVLPVTGTEAAFFAVGALLLLGAGTTAIIAARRRTHR